MNNVEAAARAVHAPVGGGWLGDDLAARPERWLFDLPDAVVGELLALGGRISSTGGSPRDPSASAPEVSGDLRDTVDRVLESITGEPGLVVLTGFPVTAPMAVVEAAYWVFGRLLGAPVSQTRDAEFIARVEDRGADIGVPTQRGHRSASGLAFHVDRTDLVGLLCIRSAREGGMSRLVSSKALHDIVLAERPDLMPVLYAGFPNDQRGEQATGTPTWCAIPVFSRVGDDFAARYVRRFIEGSQRHDDAPRLTGRQIEAMDVIDDVLERPGVALEMELRPGHLQLINNFHLLHARTAFRNAAGDGNGRLLLRMWLSFAGSPALPADYAPLVGDTSAGAYRGGVWPSGLRPHSTS